MDPCVRRVVHVFKSTFPSECGNSSEFIQSLFRVYSSVVIMNDMSSFFEMQFGVPLHPLIFFLVLSHSSFFLFLKIVFQLFGSNPEFPFPKPMLYQLSNLAGEGINLYHLFRFVRSSNINNYSVLLLMLSC